MDGVPTRKLYNPVPFSNRSRTASACGARTRSLSRIASGNSLLGLPFSPVPIGASVDDRGTPALWISSGFHVLFPGLVAVFCLEAVRRMCVVVSQNSQSRSLLLESFDWTKTCFAAATPAIGVHDIKNNNISRTDIC